MVSKGQTMITETGLVAHYTKSGHLEKFLGKGNILLGPIGKMNDPRESDLGWVHTEGIGDTFDIDGWRNAENLKANLKYQLRLFCGTLPKSEIPAGACPIETSIYGRPRMWAQYGENSKGFCVLFYQSLLDNAIKSSLGAEDIFISDHVDYVSWLHIVSGGAPIEYGGKLRPDKDTIPKIINHNDMLRSIYFKKAMDWSDECEYRWLVYSNKSGDMLIDVKKAIHSVVLGCNFPAEKYDEVRGYCRNLKCDCYALNYCHPRYDLIKMKL